MPSALHHLARASVAPLIEPLHDPAIAGFVHHRDQRRHLRVPGSALAPRARTVGRPSTSGSAQGRARRAQADKEAVGPSAAGATTRSSCVGAERRPRTTGAWMLAAAVLFSMSNTAGAQRPASPAGGADNLVHPPGTVVAATGRLGHVERRGTGPVSLILIPGTPFGWHVWEGFMRRNSDRYTMFAITLPGYGGTPPWPMPLSARPDGTPDYGKREWSDAVIGAVVDLIAEEGLDRPVVVSNHLIADVLTLRLGLEHPDKVGGIVVSAGSPGWRLPQGFANRDAWVHDDRVPFYRTVAPGYWRQNMVAGSRLTRDSAYARTLVQEQAAAPLPTQVRYFLEFLATELAPDIGGLEVPFLALDVPLRFDALAEPVRALFLQRADGDVDAARRAYESISPWHVAGVPRDFRWSAFFDTGILLMHDRPADFDAAIQEFVDSLKAAEPPPRSASANLSNRRPTRLAAEIDNRHGQTDVCRAAPAGTGRPLRPSPCNPDAPLPISRLSVGPHPGLDEHHGSIGLS